MKRIIQFFLIIAFMISLSACSSRESNADNSSSAATADTESTQQNTDSQAKEDSADGQAVKRLRCTFDDGSVGYIEDLTDTVTTREFVSLLPMEVTFSDWDQREYYISRQLTYDEADAQTSYAPAEFTYWCGGWITAYYDTNEDTVIEAGSVVIGMMDEVFLSKLKSAGGANVSVKIEAENSVSEQMETNSDTPVVYFTSDISAEGLVRLYEALGWQPTGNVAVKISTGEPPASNYLRPELIGDLVQQLNGTIVECNTAYGGSRASSAMHRQVAEDHGFTAIADFDLMDEDGEVEWPVTGGVRLDKIIVGDHAENYTDWVILSHFKGHAMAGFGGAIKNVGIGISSASGKVYVHSAGTRTNGSIMHSDQDAWLEALAEMVTGFRDHVGEEHIIYINVMNRLSVDCDCDGNPAEPDIHDIGILAGFDPVALDQACVDLIYQAKGNRSLVQRIESRNGIHTLEHAEEIGLGNRTYEMVNIDE